MPTYAYICPACKTTTEAHTLQKPLCPKCRAMMRRDWRAERVTNTFTPTKGGKS